MSPAANLAQAARAAASLVFKDFHDLREEFAAYEAVSTEDVLAALLPLMRQAAEIHEKGLVAPLDGVEALRSDRGRLFFENARGAKPRWNNLGVNELMRVAGAFDPDAAAGAEAEADPVLSGPRGAPERLERPGFIAGHRSWEHLLGHHDPLTDIFSLGMIGCSLATGLDFTEQADLERFTAERRRLIQLNKRLHPVAARILTSMTELDRRRRAQDLPHLIHALENHRLQETAGGVAEDLGPEVTRTEAILGALRGRLYDLSRRNRLLHHKTSSAELNLTEASCPIVLRADAIRADQLLTWRAGVADRLAKGDWIPLADYIRFEEAPHAAASLDRLRAQARKDRAEFGFSQLRLVLAFLHWRDIKNDPETPVVSPLLLAPIELRKRRSVRDSYEMRAAGREAELNPTLRRALKLLYDIDLPETAPLGDADAAVALVDAIQSQIAESQPSVKIERMDAPDIDAIHRRAQRRADVHRARQRSAEGGLRRRGEVAYSYAQTNYRPLGVQLFERYVAPAAPPRRAAATDQMALPLAGDAPREIGGAARALSAAASSLRLKPPASLTSGVTPTLLDGGAERGAKASKRRARTADETAAPAALGNEFAWAVDFCALTLANFNYRKMSLVRDYDALLGGADDGARETAPETGPATAAPAAFEQLFRDGPRPLGDAPGAPTLLERYPVVPSDPTQDGAVWRARTGESYVIQGPPGAGKSQTIANLVADFLGRGKRVLFVCEKRAALDVVHHRLKALGLHRLCALVHDSQADKKGFVLDLKQLHETWLEAPANAAAERRRTELAETIERALETFELLDEDMRAETEGEPTHALIDRASAAAGAEPLTLADRDLLPTLRDWRAGREAAHSVARALSRMGSEPILARHPGRFVSAEAAQDPQLFDRLTQALETLAPHLEAMRAAANLAVWPEEAGQAPLSALFAQIDYARRLEPVANARKLLIFNPDSHLAERFRKDTHWLAEARKALVRAQERTELWLEGRKFSPDETRAALRLAQQHETGYFGFLSSAWRQLKSEVAARCALDDMTIKPQIRDLLRELDAEHEAAADVERHLNELGNEIGLANGEDALALVAERDAGQPAEGRDAAPLLKLIAREDDSARGHITQLAALGPAADAARAAIAACFDGLDVLPVDRAFAALAELDAGRDALPAFAPALRALAEAPESVRAALRRVDAGVDQLDAAILDRAVERAMALRPALREASGDALDQAADSVAALLSELRAVNAETLIDRARGRFVEHMALAQRLDMELDPETQGQRRLFNEARRDLDRELNKSGRFRSVRELMSGPAGLLVRDLKPIWLMSPLSVADVLPLEEGLFDVAIFDEASQVPLEEAAPTLFRAPQVIVVGDEKQLPPTNFFGGGGVADEDFDDDEDADWIDLDADSFLSQAAKTLPSTLLGWHYRSRSEELIAFSNAVFYGGRLISIPSVRRASTHGEIVADGPEDGADGWREALSRAVSFHQTRFAVYERQRNRGEAGYVAEMVRGLLKAKTGKTIGVVAFSEAQQGEIERALDALARDDTKFRDLYEAELEREEDGQFEGLFVKNLENVQGDERDIIIVSVCYGPERSGRMRMNFGPINRAGGERRLNVIFSRAKEHIALVSTIRADAVTNDYNTGALALKTYLRYAEAASAGDAEAMRRALAAVAPHSQTRRAELVSPVAERIAAALRERGLEADTAVGESAFLCDLAVRRPGAAHHELSVLLDGPAHYANTDLVERHIGRPGVLRAFGWRTLTVMTLDWRRSPEAVIERIERALKGDDAQTG